MAYLKAEVFNRFLSVLDPDRERAAVRYEQIRERLIEFFALKGRDSSEDLADEVIDRVVRKLDAFEGSENVDRHIYSVAKFLLLESSRRVGSPTPEIPVRAVPAPDDVEEMGHQCLEHCLAQLPSQARDLILRYYAEDHGRKIEDRKALARELGLTVNALRIWASHIRATLHKCMTQCIEQGGPKN